MTRKEPTCLKNLVKLLFLCVLGFGLQANAPVNAQEVGFYVCQDPDGKIYRAKSPSPQTVCRFIVDEAATKRRKEESAPSSYFICRDSEGRWVHGYDQPIAGRECKRQIIEPENDDDYCDRNEPCYDEERRGLVIRLSKFSESCASKLNLEICKCMEHSISKRVPYISSQPFDPKYVNTIIEAHPVTKELVIGCMIGG